MTCVALKVAEPRFIFSFNACFVPFAILAADVVLYVLPGHTKEDLGLIATDQG